jgi:transcriptional regulator with GAF, ATPase, and Fis domain
MDQLTGSMCARMRNGGGVNTGANAPVRSMNEWPGNLRERQDIVEPSVILERTACSFHPSTKDQPELARVDE